MRPTGAVVSNSGVVPAGPEIVMAYKPDWSVGSAWAIASRVYVPALKLIEVPEAIPSWTGVLPWNRARLGAVLSADGNCKSANLKVYAPAVATIRLAVKVETVGSFADDAAVMLPPAIEALW